MPCSLVLVARVRFSPCFSHVADEDGTLKLVDFGFAKAHAFRPGTPAGPLGAIAHDASVATGGVFDSTTRFASSPCGTPGFVAPEVLKRVGYYSCSVDMWSLGVLIPMAVHGRPWPSMTFHRLPSPSMTFFDVCVRSPCAR